MNRTEDRQLIARLQARDEAAVHELAERYGSRIYQLALRQMKNRGGRRGSDAGRADEGLPEDRRVSRRLGAFIVDLPHHVQHRDVAAAELEPARAAQQHERPRDGQDDERATPRQPADWSQMPDEELLRAQLRHAVVTAIQELPEIYRAPVVLRDIEGLTTEEASTRLHVKDQTLKSRLHRGRLMLRERLQAFTSGLNLHRPTPAYS